MTKQIRHTETKNNIKKALAQLLSQKNFEKLSVTAICEAAGINRGTFYLHYKDKYDMMEKLKEEVLSDVYQMITQETKAFTPEVICDALAYLKKDIDFFSVLANTSYVNLPLVLRDFITYILDNIPEFDEFITNKMGVPLNYAKTAYVASIEAVMTEWILSGGKEDPREMTNIIKRLAD